MYIFDVITSLGSLDRGPGWKNVTSRVSTLATEEIDVVLVAAEPLCERLMTTGAGVDKRSTFDLRS